MTIDGNNMFAPGSPDGRKAFFELVAPLREDDKFNHLYTRHRMTAMMQQELNGAQLGHSGNFGEVALSFDQSARYMSQEGVVAAYSTALEERDIRTRFVQERIAVDESNLTDTQARRRVLIALQSSNIGGAQPEKWMEMVDRTFPLANGINMMTASQPALKEFTRSFLFFPRRKFFTELMDAMQLEPSAGEQHQENLAKIRHAYRAAGLIDEVSLEDRASLIENFCYDVGIADPDTIEKVQHKLGSYLTDGLLDTPNL